MWFRRSRVAICLYVRDEDDQIAEWLAYQHVVGADACILYDNRSVDQTRAVAHRMAGRQDVRIVDWPNDSPTSHVEACRDCMKRFRKEFDWIAFFDIDEFIVLKRHKSLKDLVADRKDCSAILVNWAMFGSSGHEARPAGLTIDNFTRRADFSFLPSFHVKSIIRTRDYVNMNNMHHAAVTGRSCHPDGTICERTGPGIAKVAKHDVCQLNHYFVRSRAQWTKKVSRSYRSATRRTDEQFDAYDRNEVADTSALAYSEKVKLQLRAAGVVDG